jgi:hypothetical protein
MKRWEAGTAGVGVAAMVLSGVLSASAAAAPANAGVARSAGASASTASTVSSPYFGTRYFNCYPEYGCAASGVLPKNWRAIRLGTDHYRFADRTAPRMIRIRMNLREEISTATAAQRKQAALRGTPGLKVLSRRTTTVNAGQGPLTMTTLVYTYRQGSTTRWVATRYLGMWGIKSPNVELTVGGRLQDRALLTKVLAKATTSITLAG